MRKASYIAALLGLTLCSLPPEKAAAQQFDAGGIVYEAARNRIGLMRYCRNYTSLDTAVAEKAVRIIEADLRAFTPENELARELGDRAEEAGEDGFLDVVRRRDIASFAKLFRSTPAGLCQEWAAETLRVQEPGSRGYNNISIATIEPIRAGRTIAPPSPDITQAIAIPQAAVLPPPVPAKPPFRLVDAQPVSQQQQTVTMAARVGNSPFSPQIQPVATPLGINPPPSSQIKPVAAQFCDRDEELFPQQ
jgi:hypothetical protein